MVLARPQSDQGGLQQIQAAFTERRLSALFRAFCIGSAASSAALAHKNPGTFSSMQAMFEHERNPL
jgi:hypothetical protein